MAINNKCIDFTVPEDSAVQIATAEKYKAGSSNMTTENVPTWVYRFVSLTSFMVMSFKKGEPF